MVITIPRQAADTMTDRPKWQQVVFRKKVEGGKEVGVEFGKIVEVEIGKKWGMEFGQEVDMEVPEKVEVESAMGVA